MIEFIRNILRYKWFVFGMAILFGFGTAIFIFNAPDEYKAEAMLMPVSDNSNGGLGALGSQLGGLASIAGINVNSGGNDKVALALALVNDWDFVDTFIKKHNIKGELLAVDGWDRQANKLIYDTDSYDINSKSWKLIDGKMDEPSDWKAFVEFKKRIVFRQDKSSPLIIADLTYYSPLIAKQWLELLVEDINHKIKLMDLNDTKLNIDYLNQQIESTNLTDIKEVFYELMQEQLKTYMLAEVRSEYVLKKIGKIKVPEVKFKPRRLLLVVLGTFMGILFGLLIICIKPFLVDIRYRLNNDNS